MSSRCFSLCLSLLAVAWFVGLSVASASTIFDFSPGSGNFPFTAPGGFVDSGQPSFNQTESGITLTATAAGGNGNIGVANNPNAAPTTVGIGVAGGGGAALQANGESITVTFDTNVLLEEIVLDGHAPPEQAGVALPGFAFSLQQASTINGSAPAGTSFSGAGGATVDDTVTFGTPFALSSGQTIVFTNTTSGGYFVRSITVGVVPEPASLALLGLGGLALLATRRIGA